MGARLGVAAPPLLLHSGLRFCPSHHRRIGGHPTLSGLYGAMAHLPTLSPTRLERSRLLGRAAFAAAALGSRSGVRNSPSRQPAFSPPPRRPRRLPAPHRRPRSFPFLSSLCVRGSCAPLHPAGHSLHVFELHRRPIPQRRVQPPLVINFIHESRARSPHLRHIAVFLPIHLFVFQGFHPRLAARIFPRARFVTHADFAPI